MNTWALHLIKPHSQHGALMTGMLQWMAALRTGPLRSTFLEHLLCADGCLCFVHRLVQPHSLPCVANASTNTAIPTLTRRLSPGLSVSSSSKGLRRAERSAAYGSPLVLRVLSPWWKEMRGRGHRGICFLSGEMA